MTVFQKGERTSGKVFPSCLCIYWYFLIYLQLENDREELPQPNIKLICNAIATLKTDSRRSLAKLYFFHLPEAK